MLLVFSLSLFLEAKSLEGLRGGERKDVLTICADDLGYRKGNSS